MTITSNDIKLFQAQDNTDNDNGGGSRTSTEIVDGDVNNLFPDISRIDTVSGDVALRKIFPTVTTDNRDVYYGAHSMLRKPPTDEKVSALIFHTDNPYDTRIEAQDKIESYVVASYKEDFYLYGNHVAGAKSVTFLQTIESKTPDVGEVYLIKEGVEEQFIRIASIDTQEITLTYSAGGEPTPYIRRRIICEIDQALEFAFNGSPFHPSGQTANTADTWATQVADAAKFYSTKTLLDDALVDDVVIKVDSIFEQLVPASKKQTPLINKQAMVQGVGLIATGNLFTTQIISANAAGVPFQLPHPIVPKSVTKAGDNNYKDDGLGNLINTGASDAIVGSVDYKAGTMTFNVSYTNPIFNYEIASAFDSNIQFTGEIKITQENVGNVFTRRLSPIPSASDLYIDYRSNGKWYRFASTGNREDGNETIGGDSNIGSGSLNDNMDGTGTVSMTLASTPDIDSSIIISWGSAEKLSDRSNLIAAETGAAMIIPLGRVNIDPLSFVMQIYTATYGSIKNVTALADGTLVDEVNKIKGTLDFINGEVAINSTTNNSNRFDPLNSANNVIIDFNHSTAGIGEDGVLKEVRASVSPAGDEVPFTAQDVEAGTFSFDIGEVVKLDGIKLYLKAGNSPLTLECDNLGILRKYGRSSNDNTTYGSIAVGGIVNVQMPEFQYQGVSPNYLYPFGTIQRYINETRRRIPQPLSGGHYVLVKYHSESPLSYSQSHNITDKYENISSYRITTLPNIAGEVGCEFPTSSVSLYSKGGLIFNNNGSQIGVIDYVTGVMDLTCFNKPDDFSINFTKLFTDDVGDDDTISNFTFRTAATKLTTSSFQLSYETANGNYIATSDANGVITGTDIDSIESYVDTQTGMANIVFTEQTTASSLKYDAVAESSLPLDPELLGLNPVRLPSDGRVPVFKAGYHLIIFNEVTTAVINGGLPIVDQVNTLARSGQAHIEVIDANGKRLNPTQYVADREVGTVTFTNPLALQDKYGVALTAPFSIVDRVEDMLLATDVQINGLISLSAGLSRDYDQGVTKVASALVWGDTGARVYNLFAQEIWDSGNPAWSDARIGDNTTAQYDDLNNPIQIDNESSSAGRWAIIFRSSTTVDVVHEKLGVVQSNVPITIEDVAPINPATSSPYFVMIKEGFGAGWVTNNVIRLNTDSGDNNMWVIRTVQSGALSELNDSIDIEVRGDAN